MGRLLLKLPWEGTVTVASVAADHVLLQAGSTTIKVLTLLPIDMLLPITPGQTLQLHLCQATPLADTYLVVAKDQGGRLLFVGGKGVGLASLPCISATGFSIERVDLACAPRQQFAGDAGPGSVFAFKFVGDTTVTLSQGHQAQFTLGGAAYSVAVFEGYHTIEWRATDIYGSIEAFLVVAR